MKTCAGLLLSLVLVGCATPQRPIVGYEGTTLPPRHPDTALYFYRDRHPPRPWSELGMVRVRCPLTIETSPGLLGPKADAVGGCGLAQITELMRRKAIEVGADGICMLETSAGSNGAIVAGMATVFKFKPEPPAPRPAPKAAVEDEEDDDEEEAAAAKPAPAPKPSVEDRLKELQRLRDRGVITKDEYAQRRAEILKEI